ncbi:hypothetical protein BH23GEM6_BH23GEM6_01070 [soil metagenome]
MDWFTILLVFIFVVLPLIQQIAEARKRSRGETGLPRDEEVEHEVDPVAAEYEAMTSRERSGDQLPAESEAEWSSGWGSWPGEASEEEVEPEVVEAVSRPSPEPVIVRFEPQPRAERPAPEQRRERVLYERKMPDQQGERVLYERPVPVEAVVVDHRSRARPAVPRLRELSVPVLGARRGSTALGLAVHDRRELRRAILLSEVLGPPRSLKPLDNEQS